MAPSWFAAAAAMLVAARNPQGAAAPTRRPAHDERSTVKARPMTLAKSPWGGRFERS